MNENVIEKIENQLNISKEQIEIVLKLLSEDNTIPFIARYRKNLTNGLDEDMLRKIQEVYDYQNKLLNRKEDVIRLIAEKDMLTEEIKNNILNCTKLIEVEDIYRPYKEKKKTKATEAIALGLEPLAKMIMSTPKEGSIDTLTKKFINDKVKSSTNALEGACYIIAEWISDNSYYRKWIRNYIFNNGILVVKKKKDCLDEKHIFEMYYDYNEKVKYIKPHRILAINRGEKLKVLQVKIDIEEDIIYKYLEEKVIKNKDSFVCKYIEDSIKDSYKRLIFPSISREIRIELNERAEIAAIDNFSKNLEALLLTPPLKEKIILGFDPGYVNGCKLAVINKTGKFLDSCVIKPFIKNSNLEKDKKQVLDLIKKYNIDVIAIGNGTASRESEQFVSSLIKDNNLSCKYIIVSEAGASIYSASNIAKEEFPDLEIEKRSAVSIARRVQDSLAELVKIPPSGIGVGLYQHDVNINKLKDVLDFTVEKCVNSVGVNINTASFSLLSYVSGLSKKIIEKLIKYREDVGKIKSREELLKNKILSNKAYEQAIGFLRIIDGDNILDMTAIHPESYNVAFKIFKDLDIEVDDIGSLNLREKLDNINLKTLETDYKIDAFTLTDIIEALKKPNLDPRDEYPQPILKTKVLDIDDLEVGMHLQGTVRNVVDFGLFIDIGLHEDGLAHISKLSHEYIKHPKDLFSVGDIVDCYVDEILKEKNKVNLSMFKNS